MEQVRTRFAPSPTGYLHLGGARTALFNWAFARRHGGVLVLRLEDTDRKRSTREAEAAVLEGLRWLGIDWDEGPLRQSERAERYAAAIERLLEAGRAYRCVCTREQIEERRAATIAAGNKWVYDGRCREAGHAADCGPHTVRLRLPAQGRLAWDDLVFGPSGQDASEIGDMIIRRSDGNPLYHLAGVVDDVEMGISHVIRGADHHSNTPFHLALYGALDAPPPRFAHVPLIVGSDGKKLSKRRAPVAIQHYQQEGYLAQAVRNWLVRIGWSHGDQEIFSRDEVAALFDLDAVHRAAAQAEPSKLVWLNQHYIKTLPRKPLLEALLPFLEAEVGQPVAPSESLARLVDLLRDRSKTLADMARRARFLVVQDDALHFDEKAVRKHWRPEIGPALADLRECLAALESWSEGELEQAFEAVGSRHGNLSLGKLAQPVRVAITGEAVSPGMFETLAVLGRERTLARIDRALERIRAVPAGSLPETLAPR
jgi:glutamyl-tRNA synthetase